MTLAIHLVHIENLDLGTIGRLHSISCRTRMGDGWQTDAYLARQPYFRTMPQLLVYETGVHFIDVPGVQLERCCIG